jgi:Sulfotransferase family
MTRAETMDPPRVGATRLVYLLAASHSGSTLLAMLLGSHPEICTVGELKATALGDVEWYRCSCKERIKDCSFWAGVARDMDQRGFVFDITDAGTDFGSGASSYVRRLLRPLHRGPLLEAIRDAALALSPGWRARLPQVQAVNGALAACLCARTGKQVVVDSSKVGLRLKYLLRNPALDVRVVRLIRDGRSVALTYLEPAAFADARDPTLRGGGWGGDRAAERLAMADAAREWRRSNEEADAIVRSLPPSRWLEVRYERLCRDPESTLRTLFEFIGVDPTRVSLDFRALPHHVIGNGMRLDSTGDIRFDERWPTALGAQDRETFERIAGALNRRLGYV